MDVSIIRRMFTVLKLNNMNTFKRNEIAGWIVGGLIIITIMVLNVLYYFHK